MEFRIDTMRFCTVRAHTCRDTEICGIFRDVTAEANAMVDDMALANLNLSTPASTIWKAVRDRFYPPNGPDAVQGPDESQIVSRVYRIRKKSFGGNHLSKIEMPPLSLVQDSSLPFFKFHYTTAGTDPLGKPNRILGWAHPTLVNLLRYKDTSVFVDATFRCVPRDYAQCVIIMVEDRASGIFVPVFYVLTTARTADTYWDVIHFVDQHTDQQLSPGRVVCDFEHALITAIQTQFPDADVVGCLFHWNQAIGRRMKKLRLSEQEIKIAMTSGYIDRLTVIDTTKVESHGIPWCRREIRRKCQELGITYARAKWKAFWSYFVRTWIKRYPPKIWNVHGISNGIIARINNSLERFNRELHKSVPGDHPALPAFIHAINKVSVEYASRLAAITSRRSKRKPRETIKLPEPMVFTDDPIVDSDEESIVDSDEELMVDLDEEETKDDDSESGEMADTSFDYSGSEASFRASEGVIDQGRVSKVSEDDEPRAKRARKSRR